MVWLTNIYDPRSAKARYYTPSEDWKEQQRWLEGKVLGPPKATKAYTVEELERMGYVGVYKL